MPWGRNVNPSKPNTEKPFLFLSGMKEHRAMKLWPDAPPSLKMKGHKNALVLSQKASSAPCFNPQVPEDIQKFKQGQSTDVFWPRNIRLPGNRIPEHLITHSSFWMVNRGGHPVRTDLTYLHENERLCSCQSYYDTPRIQQSYIYI